MCVHLSVYVIMLEEKNVKGQKHLFILFHSQHLLGAPSVLDNPKFLGHSDRYRSHCSGKLRAYEEATYFPFLYFPLVKSFKYQIRPGETFLLVVVVILISYRSKRTCIRETFPCL